MIIVDTNVLLYAYDITSERHHEAVAWLESVMNGQESIGLPFLNLLAFIRISTNPRVFGNPLGTDDALSIVQSWLARPQVVIPAPTSRHWDQLAEVCRDAQATGPLVMDAHLATLAQEHGARICTTDRDFRRFDGLTTIEPSAPV